MNTINDKQQGVLRLISIVAFSVLACIFSSCSHDSTRQISPSFSQSKMSQMRSFYVRKDADDDYHLAEDIVAELNLMGYSAISGSAQSSPKRVDGVITYKDRWMWDMTMYMLSLDVQLREPGSDMILANTKTVRTSLVRRSQENMVRETLTKLFKNQ